jgi:hypothetical protein
MSILRALPLVGLLVLLAPDLPAQALLAPPPPPPSALEREVAGIDSVERLAARAAALREASEFADLAVVLRRMMQLQPQVGRHRYELAAALAQQEDRRGAYDLLLRMHGQGYAYDLAADARFEKVADTRVWEYLVANYEANRRPFGAGEVAFELPAADLLLESVAWDPRGNRLLFGSMRSGGIYTRGDDGDLVPVIKADSENGLWSVLDLKVDAARGKLWVASAAMPFFEGLRPEHLGISGLFRFDLDSGKLERRWLIPPEGGPNALISIAVGRQGEVYAMDGLRQVVYLANEEGMQVFFASPKHTALRSLAVSEDGNRLYVADYDAGILGVDLARTQAFDLRVPDSLTLDGIESLHLWQGHLILVQSGTDPAMRVMRLTLTEDGRQVLRAQPVDANHPALTRPFSGALSGRHLYFIANSQKGLYGEHARLADGAQPQPVRIFRSLLVADERASPQPGD